MDQFVFLAQFPPMGPFNPWDNLPIGTIRPMDISLHKATLPMNISLHKATLPMNILSREHFASHGKHLHHAHLAVLDNSSHVHI